MKHRKLCGKLHTDTSSYVTICARRRVACREGFVSLKVAWLYFVSGTSVGNYVTNRVSCVKSYACTCFSNSKSVQTCLFSARTHALTRHVVDTVRGNMVVEIVGVRRCPNCCMFHFLSLSYST